MVKADVKQAINDLNRLTNQTLLLEKNSREISIAKTKIEEAEMWLQKALAIEGAFDR